MAVESKPIHKSQRIGGAAMPAMIAGMGISGWQLDGNPSHGAVPPTTMDAPTNTTAGALKQSNPAGGSTRYLHNSQAILVPIDGQFAMYDRLLHVSGFSGTSTSEQFCEPGQTFVAVTRINDLEGGDGHGNGIFVEIYTQIGVTPQTLTVNYKNQDNTTVSSTVTIGGTGRREAGRWIEVPLAAGDAGVRSIKSVQLGGSTGTAGDFGVVVAFRYLSTSHAASHAQNHCGPVHGFTKIASGACIMFAFWPATTALTVIALAFEGFLTFVDKPD